MTEFLIFGLIIIGISIDFATSSKSKNSNEQPTNLFAAYKYVDGEKVPAYYDGPVAHNLDQLFEQIDADGDGKISVDEAAIWYGRIVNRAKEDVQRDPQFYILFAQADANSDGFIDRGEMKTAMEFALAHEDEDNDEDGSGEE